MTFLTARGMALRNIGLTILAVAAIAAGSGAYGRFFSHSDIQTAATRHVLYYVDPMHPSYRSDRPGIAPDCGMKLVPVYADDAAKHAPAPKLAQMPDTTVEIDSGAQLLSGIRVSELQRRSIARVAHVVGRVTPEDMRVYSINSGVDGFIRDTFDDSVGSAVKKNQILATYYAPDFLPAASGFLAATERVPGTVGKDGARFSPAFPGAIAKEGVRSIQGYTDHLRNLGMSDEQIKRIADSGELPESIDIVSPVDGYIVSRNVSPGQHFDHMMEFYKIADLSKVWVMAEVNEDDARSIRSGRTVQIDVRTEGRRLLGKVTNSLLQSEAGGGSDKVRIEVDNPGFLLRPEMLVDADIPLDSMAAVTVSMDALVYSGEHTQVYVERGPGVFEAREVRTGRRLGDQIEILSGVQPGERIVVAGTFLVDSEARLKSGPEEAPADSNPAERHDHMAMKATAPM